ncbi:hypothetical protein [Nannocystis punicea]|uniref:Uncharacterized protein n=1 Tax=Nannocystis punicea TaxID=2995304 RepID=A0ABY7HFF8_9BACT|nr:hypothetical protein [Nannocystis poenicansa]WAS98023.1 hypothetical protein O0S08_17925 [Nannocystis poenicansa]
MDLRPLAALQIGVTPARLSAVTDHLDDPAESTERRPDEAWLAHQERLARLAYAAQGLGPERGAELLRRVWSAAEYRDVFWQIAKLVVTWGAGSVAFLRTKLAEDPSRTIGVVVQAKSYGAEGLDALLPDLRALASDPDPDLADAAGSACDWLDGTRDAD